MRRKLTWTWMTASLLILGGCGPEAEEPAENVATPSQAAEITNENPTSPTVDVPVTPLNEAAGANTEAAGATPAETPAAATPAETPADETP